MPARKFKKRYLLIGILLALLILFFAGPRPEFQPLDPAPVQLDLALSQLDEHIRQQEAKVTNLRPDNQARIIWADSIRQTPWSIVYLHGWSASQEEGDPIHEELARRYGYNLYLARLRDHGIGSEESFAELTPNDLLHSAKEALAIGQKLGQKVVLMSCSTGSTLSMYLAATQPEAVVAQLMYSPNIDIYDPTSKLLTMPWGAQMAEQVNGHYHSFEMPPGAEQYWTTTYRTKGLICLRSLVDQVMTRETFSKVDQPTLAMYWYQDEEQQDKVISVEAIQEMSGQISTPADDLRLLAVPKADTHVILSRFGSKALDEVRSGTFNFVEEVLGWKPTE